MCVYVVADLKITDLFVTKCIFLAKRFRGCQVCYTGAALWRLFPSSNALRVGTAYTVTVCTPARVMAHFQSVNQTQDTEQRGPTRNFIG